MSDLTSQKTQSIAFTKANQLMLFGGTVTVYCENHTKHTNTVCVGKTQSPFSTVAYFLKARNVELEKRPLLGNSCVTRNNGVTVGSGVFCVVRAEAI
jgi:hypothetical protein